jgi:hypothetical protein
MRMCIRVPQVHHEPLPSHFPADRCASKKLYVGAGQETTGILQIQQRSGKILQKLRVMLCAVLLLMTCSAAWADAEPETWGELLTMGLGWRLCAGEIVVTLIEAMVMLWVLKIAWWRAGLTSLVANIVSFAGGDTFNALAGPHSQMSLMPVLGILLIITIVSETAVIYLMNRSKRFPRILVMSTLMNSVTLAGLWVTVVPALRMW